MFGSIKAFLKISIKSQKVFSFFCLAILSIFPMIMAILYAPIDPDSSYYLSIVERLNDGFIPYIDLKLHYTPVYFYMLLFLKHFFAVGINYDFFLTVQFILQCLCAFVVFKISILK